MLAGLSSFVEHQWSSTYHCRLCFLHCPMLMAVFVGKHLFSSPELAPHFPFLLFWCSVCFPLTRQKHIYFFAGVQIPAKFCRKRFPQREAAPMKPKIPTRPAVSQSAYQPVTPAPKAVMATPSAHMAQSTWPQAGPSTATHEPEPKKEATHQQLYQLS